MLTGEQVAAHSTQDDLWMIIHGKAYDLTDFASSHPGGLKILLKFAGKDATEEYDPIHPPGTIENTLPKDKHLGEVDMSTVAKVEAAEQAKPVPAGSITKLGECLNLEDIETAATAHLKPKAFAYYASAADDELTKNRNRSIWDTCRLRPRVLRDVTSADLSSSLLGYRSELPVFIAPAALGRLAHPEGERLLARAASRAGIPYIVSANASLGFEEIAQVAPGQTLFYQLYVNRDRSKTEDILRRVVKAGYKGIVVTVDAPVAGKRERDERASLDADSAADPGLQKAAATDAPDAPDAPDVTTAPTQPEKQGIAQQMGGYVDPSLNMTTDIKWLKSFGLPLVMKGVQTAEDAALLAAAGVDAIYLSNHGGRQLEGAPTALETLVEIRARERWVFTKCEVWVDGGVRRGTDVLKAIALGAKGVGLGRPFMYSLVFGQAGPDRVAEILAGEIGQNLRLLGATKLSELTPAMVNTRALEADLYEPYISPIPNLRVGGTREKL